MLQCTAISKIPTRDALIALTRMENGPDNASLWLYQLGEYRLCELAGDGHAEHATMLCNSDVRDDPRDLWLLWTDEGGRRRERLAELPPCPEAINRGRPNAWHCILFAEHPAVHSWEISDPLGDLVKQQAKEEAYRRFDQYDQDPD
ncbi:hypothetical protein ACIQZO_13700 [Streptomyces sp. NPDC097617]|uniref:hypothetical protein n=1 Tax=Streptomyces sp. NPDC097617 TaxID=3366091 RepID=UPI003805FC4E